MIKKNIQFFSSFENAEREERLERWAMSPQERLEMTEKLRTFMYPDANTTPRIQKVFESTEQTLR